MVGRGQRDGEGNSACARACVRASVYANKLMIFDKYVYLHFRINIVTV